MVRPLPRILTILLLAGGLARAEEPSGWTASAPAGDRGPSPPADRPIEDRVRELEETVHRLEPAPPAVGPKLPFLAGWDDKTGFVLRSPDDRFLLRITGQIQADYRYYPSISDTTDIPTFLVRRARLGIEATVMRYYEFRLLPDFGQGQSRIQDSYINIHYWDEGQFEAGKFKQPFSYEQLIQDRFVPTLERSLIDQLVPARDVGLMVHGQNVLDGRLDYGASVFGGVINGDQDTDRNKDVAGRVAVRPLRGWGLPDWAEPLQLGIAGTYGTDRGVLAPTTLRTPANVPWFQFASGVRPDGQRTRWSPEVVYVYGPMALAAQYFEEDQELRRATGRLVTVSYRGGYVLATCLLTGEERTSLSQPIVPLVPFDPVDGCFGPGAWELVGRVSCLAVDGDDPRGFARLLDPARSATRATELTAGFNWYLNAWVRMQCNWEHAWFNGPVRLGTGPAGRKDHSDALLTRFQVIF
jgi:phosphate-selective porin OprO/OprP